MSEIIELQNMAKFILVVLFLAVTIPGVSSSHCPDHPYQEWVYEDNKCQQQNPGHRYHCLYDIDKDMAIPLCAPAVNCTPGTHAKIDAIGKTVTCTPCSSDMYQPEAKVSYSFTQPNCDRRKRECGKGEVQCGEATATHNFKCSCDFSQGMRPNDINKCDCFIEDKGDCHCNEAKCNDGEILAADFSCVPKSTKDPIVSTQEYTSGDLSTGAIVGIALAVIVVVAVIVAGIVIYCCRKTMNKMSKTEYASVEKGNSSESSNTHGMSSNSSKETPIDGKRSRYTKANGRSDGALHLLHSIKRTHPDDWFDCIVKAMKDTNVGLQHIAEKMEGVREEMNGKRKQSPGDNNK